MDNISQLINFFHFLSEIFREDTTIRAILQIAQRANSTIFQMIEHEPESSEKKYRTKPGIEGRRKLHRQSGNKLKGDAKA